MNGKCPWQFSECQEFSVDEDFGRLAKVHRKPFSLYSCMGEDFGQEREKPISYTRYQVDLEENGKKVLKAF